MACVKYARAASISGSCRSPGSSSMSRNIPARWRARTPASAAMARRIRYTASAVSRGAPARAATEPSWRRIPARARTADGRAAAMHSAGARWVLRGRDRAATGRGAPACCAAPRHAGGPLRSGARAAGPPRRGAAARHADPEAAAAAQLRLEARASAHSIHRLADDGETDSRARIVGHAVQSLEYAEDPLMMLGRDPDPVVLDP